MESNKAEDDVKSNKRTHEEFTEDVKQDASGDGKWL